MPMIDVYAPADLFSADADTQLGDELTHAVLRAEGVAQPGPLHLDNTAAFIHRLPTSAISTGSRQPDRAVRVQIITPPGSLNRDGQRQITREATEIITRIAGDNALTARTWVILTEATEGGWGLSGTAFGVEEFTALARKAAEAKTAEA
jgi:phenylpyruvate tautomerase PptA (4-oxalocrotonate tautomerase family)